MRSLALIVLIVLGLMLADSMVNDIHHHNRTGVILDVLVLAVSAVIMYVVLRHRKPPTRKR